MSRVGVTPEPAWGSEVLNSREKETSTEMQKKNNARQKRQPDHVDDTSKYFFSVRVNRSKCFFLSL